MTITPFHHQFLQYVRNTGGHATAAQFDDDFEPIGPQVRRDLMPRYICEGEGGMLALTAEGLAVIS